MSRIKPTIVKISDRCVKLLRNELTKRQLEGHYQFRIQILLLSWEGKTNFEIAKLLKTSLPTVRRWRLRWKENAELIIGLEHDHRERKNRDSTLVKEIKSILSDQPRSGSSSRITDEEKLRLQALACQEPADFDLSFSVWTHVELSKQADRMGIKISSSHFGRVLKKRFTSA
jgi:transposase